MNRQTLLCDSEIYALCPFYPLSRALGRGYTVGSAAKVVYQHSRRVRILIFYGQVLYPAAGGSDDWALGGAGIPYSYTIGRAYTVIKDHQIPCNM